MLSTAAKALPMLRLAFSPSQKRPRVAKDPTRLVTLLSNQ